MLHPQNINVEKRPSEEKKVLEKKNMTTKILLKLMSWKIKFLKISQNVEY